MSRILGIVFAMAVLAAAAHSEEDRSAYTKASAHLTEQLNAKIAERALQAQPAPPAKRDEAADESSSAPVPEPQQQHASR